MNRMLQEELNSNILQASIEVHVPNVISTATARLTWAVTSIWLSCWGEVTSMSTVYHTTAPEVEIEVEGEVEGGGGLRELE